MAETIVLCPNVYRDVGLSCTLRAKDMLEREGFSVRISPVFEPNDEIGVPEGLELTPLQETAAEAEMLVSFGGDGTILHTARAARGHEVPIIGVNLGTKGFMAELEPDMLERLVTAARGSYTKEYRMMIDVTLLRNGEVAFSDTALNDAVINGIARTVHLRAWGDGQLMTEFSGDGVILATPTGSTAYSMSAGGPIVEPTAENILLTPICPHTLTARSFVLAPSREVRIQIARLTDDRRAVLSVDGDEPIDLCTGDELIVRRSRFRTLLAHVGDKSFYDIAYEKLGERRV